METILEGRCEVPYLTNLRLVFKAIGDRQREFNWLITDLEYLWLGGYDDEEPPSFTSEGWHQSCAKADSVLDRVECALQTSYFFATHQ